MKVFGWWPCFGFLCGGLVLFLVATGILDNTRASTTPVWTRACTFSSDDKGVNVSCDDYTAKVDTGKDDNLKYALALQPITLDCKAYASKLPGSVTLDCKP